MCGPGAALAQEPTPDTARFKTEVAVTPERGVVLYAYAGAQRAIRGGVTVGF